MSVKEFKVQYVYHTAETAETTVLATSVEAALEIAEYAFKKQYTAKCILDHIEVQP